MKELTGLVTKFRPPRRPSRIIERDRLLNAATNITDHLITAIIAPGGYGKSTLMTSWRMDLISAGSQVVWVTIDEADRSVDQLVRSLSQAFQIQEVSFEHFVVDAGLEDHDAVDMQLDALLVAVEKSDKQTILFLDDVHLLASSEGLGVVQGFVSHAPDNLFFVMASRQDLPEIKSDLQSKGLIHVIDAQSLAFDLGETTEFLRTFGRQDLTLAHIDLLHFATEGWVAGLHLACASLKASKNLDESIEKFSGETSIVSDYIWNTVIQDLSEEDRDFLENLALLNAFTPQSCDFIFGGNEAEEKLPRLAAQIPFIICLDEFSQTYRLQVLLRDFLLARLKKRNSGPINEIHLRAFSWYRDHQMVAEAIDHALAADEPDKVLDLIEQCARDVVSVGGLPLISSWIKTVPREMIENRLSLQMVLVVAYSVSRQIPKAEECLVNIRDLLEKMPEGPEKDRSRSEFLFLSALPLVIVEDIGKGLKFVEKSDFLSADIDPWLKGIAANSAALCHFFDGNISRAHELMAAAQVIEEDTQGHFRHVYTLGLAGLLAAAEGKISQADTCYQKAMRMVTDDDQGRGLPFIVTAIFMLPGLYARGRFDEIRQLMANRSQMALRNTIVLFITPAMTSIARMRFALGQEERAEQILGEFQGIAVIENLDYAQSQIMMVRAEQAIRKNRVQEFERFARGVEELYNKEGLDRIVKKMIGSDVLVMAVQRYVYLGVGDDVTATLEKLLDTAEIFLPAENRLSLTVYLFLCTERRDGPAAASAVLTRAVGLGSDLGYTQTFVDIVSMFPLLLTKLEAWDIDNGDGMTQKLFVTSVLEAFKRQRAGQLSEPKASVPRISRQEVVVEVDASVTLSPRERDILTLVARGQKNRDIAKSLGITPETVKWHMKHIFQKLQVTNRTRAVRVAEHLNLIEF